MDVPHAFFDYSISEQCVSNGNYEKTIKKLYGFGYRTVAINQLVDESCLETKKKKKKGEPRDEIVPVPITLKAVEGCEDMKILNRLTVVFGSQDSMYKISKSQLFKRYHILALQPTTQAAFQFTCSNLDADILTFDPEEKAMYKCNRKLYSLLTEKGFHFEVMYGPAIQDSSQRKNIIHVSHLYHTFGKSRNIILSSGATNPFLVRSPYDVVNLGLIFGLNEQQSKNAITFCGRNVYVNSVGRRHGKTVMLVENLNSTNNMMELEDDEEEDMEVNQPAQKKIKSVG